MTPRHAPNLSGLPRGISRAPTSVLPGLAVVNIGQLSSLQSTFPPELKPQIWIAIRKLQLLFMSIVLEFRLLQPILMH